VVPQDRKGLDFRRCGTRREPDFPDCDGRRISSCEPQGSSASPDVVRERNDTLDRMGIHAYTGGDPVHDLGRSGVSRAFRGENKIPRTETLSWPWARLVLSFCVHL